MMTQTGNGKKVMIVRADGKFLSGIGYHEGVTSPNVPEFQWDDVNARIFDECQLDGSPDLFTTKVGLDLNKHGHHFKFIKITIPVA